VTDLLGRCLAHLQQPDAHRLPAVPAPRPPARWLARPRPLASAVLLLVLVLGLGLGLGASITPLVRPLFQGDVTAGPPDRPRGDVGPPIGPDDAVLREAIVQARQGAAALEGELRQPAGAGLADPADEWLRQTRQQARALEEELRTLDRGK
jgi:hypothetical protein